MVPVRYSWILGCVATGVALFITLRQMILSGHYDLFGGPRKDAPTFFRFVLSGRSRVVTFCLVVALVAAIRLVVHA